MQVFERPCSRCPDDKLSQRSSWQRFTSCKAKFFFVVCTAASVAVSCSALHPSSDELIFTAFTDLPPWWNDDRMHFLCLFHRISVSLPAQYLAHAHCIEFFHAHISLVRRKKKKRYEKPKENPYPVTFGLGNHTLMRGGKGLSLSLPANLIIDCVCVNFYISFTHTNSLPLQAMGGQNRENR